MGNCNSFYQVVCFIQLCEAGVLSVTLPYQDVPTVIPRQMWFFYNAILA